MTPTLTIKDAVAEFMADYAIGKTEKTTEQMRGTLDEFLASCHKTDLTDIAKSDIKTFWQWVVDSSPTKSLRTASNKTLRVHTFLSFHGIRLLDRRDTKTTWRVPKYVERVPEAYDDAELDTFLAACTDYQQACFMTLLMSGLREQELIYLEWNDLDFEQALLHVRAKADYDFSPKSHKERSIVIPDELLKFLKTLPRNGKLVFPTASGKPQFKLLRTCKRIAKRAGLDADRWWLHKFRATFATQLFQKGLPLPDVMYLLGHTQMSSTMRYAGRLRNQMLREKVNAAWA